MRGRRLVAPAEVVELSEAEQDRADAAQERDQAQRAPQVGRAARPISHERLVGPVVGVGVVLPRPVGDGGPRRPGEVARQILDLGRVLDEGGGQARCRRGSAEVRAPFALLEIESGDLAGAQDQRLGRGDVPVLLQRQPRAARGQLDLVGRQLGADSVAALARVPFVADLGEPMEVLGAVVRTEIRAVTPERPVLHQAVPEKDLLPVKDRRPVEERRSLGIGDARRNRRRVRIGEDGDERQHREPRDDHEDGGVPPPGRQPAHDDARFGHGFGLLFFDRWPLACASAMPRVAAVARHVRA